MGDLAYYNAVSDKWRCYGKGKWVDYYQNMAMDPVRLKLVSTGNTYTAVWNISDTSAASLDLDTLKTTGDVAIANANSPGLEYDPMVDRIIAWQSGANVYALDLDVKTWTLIPPAATNSVTPTAPNQWGTWGRFRYVPSKDVFVLVNNTNENVFIYRLKTGTGIEYRGPKTLTLASSPNPFYRTTTLRIGAKGFDGTALRLAIYDTKGCRVADLSHRAVSGSGEISWNAADIPAGMYLARLTAASGASFQYRLVLLK
jgi:hypothetical protein